MDSCEFSGGDSASITVEGPPASEHNWACRHLTALAKMLPVSSTAMTSNLDPKDDLRATLGDAFCEVDWEGKGDSVDEGTVIEDDGVDMSGDSEDDGPPEPTAANLSYEQHGLAHLLDPGPPDLGSFPVLLSLSAELQRDPEAQELATSVQGCLIRRCLLRDGKGGVHLCNHAQARLEGNEFQRLNYAVRCIQYAKVSVWLGRLLFWPPKLKAGLYKQGSGAPTGPQK